MSTVPALSIGAIAGGTKASRAWEFAVKRLGRRVLELRDGTESPLRVNVVFHLPGELTRPAFEGVRTGKFSREDKHLLVQVALPPEPSRDADREARALLEEALALAEDFACRKGLTERPGLDSLRDLVQRL